jgi:hypothetical protein
MNLFRAGTFAAVLVLLCLLTARKFYLGGVTSSGMPAWQFAIVIHVGGWIAQV